jgi:methyl-accepting chemotaxis protein
MGAALIPHVLGVWSGQVLSSASFEAAPAIQETLFKTLAEDANTAREIIQRLFTDRERALREQIGSLQVQKRLLDDIHERNAKTAEQTLNTLTGLATSIRTAASQLSSSLEGLSTTVRAVSVSADEARTRIHSCADQVRECTGGIKEATDVVRDVAKLHDALSDLLKEKLFRASGA